MNAAHDASTTQDGSMLPLACIDAQEKEFVLPLREYLVSNGCAVSVNTRATSSATYHIAVGDADFVKDIFSVSHAGVVRRLGIVVGASIDDAKNLATPLEKIVSVDSVHLTGEDVFQIFSFFFSQNEQFLNKRRTMHVPRGNQVAPIIKEESMRSEEEVVDADTERIRHLIADVFPKEKKSVKKRAMQYKKIISTIVVIIVIFFIPFLWYGISVTAAAGAFAFAARDMKNNRFADYWLAQSRFSFSLVATPLRLAGFEKTARGQERLLSFLADVSTVTHQVMDVSLQNSEIFSLLLPDEKKKPLESPVAKLAKLRLSVGSIQSSTGLAQAQLATLLTERSLPFSIGFIHRIGMDAYAKFLGAREDLATLDRLLLLYTRFSGFGKPATYLVLLQNSNELRPTGGFIGSVGRITFEGGMMTDFTVRDVYELDGQLKGHVDPPKPIRELLSQEHWYLRDSNWDPDFRVSGEKAAWFYEKETGEKVDGVIAISLPMVVDLLSVTGPITLSDYNDRISAENFFGKSLYYTQGNFFPGSTQKSDFLGSLSRALLVSLSTKGSAAPLALFHAVSSGLKQKDLQFYFTDPELSQVTGEFSWAGGAVPSGGCEAVAKEYCVSDTLGIVDANMSVSKVNYFIKKTGLREISIDSEGVVSETVTLSVQNTVADNTPGVGGSYISYLRFFLPTDVSVDAITLDDVPVPSRSSAGTLPPLPYLERPEDTSGAQVLAVATEVPPGSTRKIQLRYRHSKIISIGSQKMVIDLLQNKQAGIRDMEQTVQIHVPVSWTASLKSTANPLEEPILAKNGQLEYNTKLTADQRIRVTFSP